MIGPMWFPLLWFLLAKGGPLAVYLSWLTGYSVGV